MPTQELPKKAVTLDQMLDGVDSTSEGHLIPDGAWRTHHNMRPFNGKLAQVGRKVRDTFLESCYPHNVLSLVNLPAARQDYGLLVALTAEHAWQIRYPEPSIKLGEGTGSVPFAYDHRYLRWGTTVYNGQLFFTNELNSVAVTDGTAVRFLGTDVPKARYIVNYFDHLVVGWTEMDGMVMPGRMHWSGLYRPSQWRPQRSNESDHWDFDEDDTGSTAFRGITGIGKLGDVLFVLTPTSIRPVRYVGLPRVFQVGENLTGGIGNGLQWGMVKANNTLFFFDPNEMNFFGFNGVQAIPIGGPVQGYLEDNVPTDPEIQQRTWAYHHPEFYEVVWVFASSSTGLFDKAVAFNYRSAKWYTRSVENLHSFGGRIRRAKGIDEVRSLTGLIGDLGNSGVLMPRYWGGARGSLWREEKTADSLSVLAAQEDPVLETKDYHYGDMQNVKEVDTITLHSSLVSGKGVFVEAAARALVDEPVVYKEPLLWTPQSSYKRLTSLRLSGRLMRFRFRPVAETRSASSSVSCSRFPLHGSLEIRLPDSGGNPVAPASYSAVGTTSGLILDAYNAPAELSLPYLYGAPPTSSPYELPQSDEMLADLRQRGLEILGGLGYTGFTEPRWEYTGSWGAYAQNAAAWPGWSSLPVVITSGWYAIMDAFYWDQQTNPPAGYGPYNASTVKTATVTGTPDGPYSLHLRIRIAAQLNTYTGGEASGYLNYGGDPDSLTKETYKLEVSSPATVIYLNRGTEATDYLVPIDQEFVLQVNKGATITLSGSRNSPAAVGGISGQPVVLAGYGATKESLARLDYYGSLASGTYQTFTDQFGGGVRGWKWSAMVPNVRAGGAEQ